MNSNQTRTLWLSLGLAVFAMFLIYSYSQEKKAEYDKRYGAAKRVVVAAKDILEMSTLDDTMVQVEEKPVEFIQPGAVENPEDAIALVAAAPIKKGEQILSTKLLTPGATTGLSLQVAPNKRAVTIPVDDVRGVAKLIRPGDRIDLISSIDTSNGPGQQKIEVKTLLQDVVVLATGPFITNNIPRKLESSPGSGKPVFRNLIGDLTFTTLTLELNPKEAQDLIFIMAAAPGSLYLTLRNPNDRALTKMTPSNINSILGRVAPSLVEDSLRASANMMQPFPTQIPQMQRTPPVQQPPRQPASQKRRNSGPFQEIR